MNLKVLKNVIKVTNISNEAQLEVVDYLAFEAVDLQPRMDPRRGPVHTKP